MISMRRSLVALAASALVAGAAACAAIVGIPQRDLVEAPTEAGALAEAGSPFDAVGDDSPDAPPDVDASDSAVDAPIVLGVDPASLAAIPAGGQLEVLVVGANGALLVAAGPSDGGAWPAPHAITDAGFAPPGAPVMGLARVSGGADAVLARADGAIALASRGTAGWLAPRAITSPGATIGGAHVAAHDRGDRIDVVYVDTDGGLTDTWSADQAVTWSHPAALGVPAPPGAPVGVGSAAPSEVDAVVITSEGALAAARYPGDAGAWTSTSITAPIWAPPGAAIATEQQPLEGATQLDVFVAKLDGAISVAWTLGDGTWAYPVPITSQGFASPGGAIAAAPQGGQLDLLTVDALGQLDVLFVVGGGEWSSPAAISDAGFASQGAPLSAAPPLPGALGAFVASQSRAWATWQPGNGPWSAPAVLF
jgi:hypothetical protein